MTSGVAHCIIAPPAGSNLEQSRVLCPSTWPFGA